MKLPDAPALFRNTVTGAVSGAVASAIGTASVLAMLAGAAYIVDCRISGGSADQCWLTGLPLMGIGAAGNGGFRTGYATYNPTLRRPDAPTSDAPTEPAAPPEPPEPPAPTSRRRTSTSRR